jgi:hypothetical protein
MVIQINADKPGLAHKTQPLTMLLQGYIRCCKGNCTIFYLQDLLRIAIYIWRYEKKVPIGKQHGIGNHRVANL